MNWWDWNVVNACRNNPDSDDYKWLAANVGWEKEGIAIYNGHMYIGSHGAGLFVLDF